MWRIVGALLLVGMVIVALKLAVALLILAGLIFRTKETIALLIFGALLTAANAHPTVAAGIVCALVAISLFFKRKERQAKGRGDAIALPAPED